MLERTCGSNFLYFLIVLTVNQVTSRDIFYAANSTKPFQNFDIVYFEDETFFIGCHELLHEYAHTSAKYTRCVVNNAKPISVCRQCLMDYLNVTTAYNQIHSSKCNDVLLNADRLQVIENVHENNQLIWSQANCQNCYNDDKTLRPCAVQFFSLVKQTQECFIKNNKTICSLDDQDLCGRNMVCSNCSEIYINLTRNYKGLLESFSLPNLCMDIVDAMNTTRRVWSADFECIRIYNNTTVLFIIVGFICIIPVVFYLSNWIRSDEHRSKIVPQKRLVATRSHAHLSSINSF